MQRANMLGEQAAIAEKKPPAIAPKLSDEDFGMIAFPVSEDSSDDSIFLNAQPNINQHAIKEARSVPESLKPKPTPKPSILAKCPVPMKRKIEDSRNETSKRMKIALQGSNSEANPVKLFIQQQAYFQELQTKQQNEFQKMLMQMMQSNSAVHE